MKKLFVCFAIATLCLSMISASAFNAVAKEYPKKPIKVIVPYSPGGDCDLTSRVWADFAKKELGVPVVVVNKTGGSGMLGSTFMLNSKPDGYTLMLAQAGTALLVPLLAGANYDMNNFTFISRIMTANCGIVVRKDAPWNTLDDFVKDAKANPGKYVFASAGATTWITLAMSNFEKMAGIELKHLEHQGSAPAITSILGKHADVTFVFPQSYAPQIKSNNMKLLALGERTDKYPGVPSFSELGYAGNYFGWGGISAPKGTPEDVVEKLDAFNKKLTRDPKFIKTLANTHADASYLGPQEFTTVVKEQNKELTNVVNSLNITK